MHLAFETWKFERIWASLADDVRMRWRRLGRRAERRMPGRRQVRPGIRVVLLCDVAVRLVLPRPAIWVSDRAALDD